MGSPSLAMAILFSAPLKKLWLLQPTGIIATAILFIDARIPHMPLKGGLGAAIPLDMPTLSTWATRQLDRALAGPEGPHIVQGWAIIIVIQWHPRVRRLGASLQATSGRFPILQSLLGTSALCLFLAKHLLLAAHSKSLPPNKLPH